IDYDPNRSSWIALVRWLQAMKQPKAANSQTEEKAKRFLGQGAKLIRAAGIFAQIIKKFENTPQCIVRLPSDVDKLIDSRYQATVGIVSNLHHGKRKLDKAGQSRWLGRCPIVRGVAMNPVDHPHGGGEGRTKG
uniref:Large ribosomal subunit protein uL2 C-terminal domain-containing protein n=1 Tax=Physcomitrium patens TaxID=3218 RepID=A0A7I4FK79_PHYPA